MIDVDVVVIGSGAGGLAAAVALARAGQRVWVLEQHTLPGGWCHSFDLHGHSFSPGVHYLGELGAGGRLRRLYEGLGVGGDLTFAELDPEGYDRVWIGDDFRFDVPRGAERYLERLCERFPGDSAALRRLFGQIPKLGEEFLAAVGIDRWRRCPEAVRYPSFVRHGLRSFASLLGDVRDPYARAVLSVQAGDHGIAPSTRGSAGLQAAVIAHYLEGAWYPCGGGRSIPKAFLKALRRHGGRITVGARVRSIRVEAGRARGVVLQDGTEIRATHVVSNADPHATAALLDPVPLGWRLHLARTRYGISTLSMFLAADVDPVALGFTSGNLWIQRSPDVEETYRYAADPDPIARGPVPAMFLTCPTLKDPTRRDAIPTFEALVFVSDAAFAPFAGSATGERPAGYQALKEVLADRVLTLVDRFVPGLRQGLVLQEMGTPLTHRHYVAATGGAMYGTEKRPLQAGPLGWGPRTSIRNLWMCGASTLGHGVVNATDSGVRAAGALLGVPVADLLDPRGMPVILQKASDVTAGRLAL